MKRKIKIIGVITILLFVFSASASALLFELKYEFDGELPVQNYGTVTVTDSGDDLFFEIAYNTDTMPLGFRADIHEFYFNLINGFTNLEIDTNDDGVIPYTLLGPNPAVVGGAGALFDWGVDFGDGSGASGNGISKYASFTLRADQALSESDLNKFSEPNNTPPVLFAVHFQGTSTLSDNDSETVGGGNPNPIPEPATMLLLGSGLFGFGVIGRKRFSKKSQQSSEARKRN